MVKQSWNNSDYVSLGNSLYVMLLSSQRSRGGLDEVNILMLPRAYMLCGPGHSTSVPFPRTLIA